MCNSSDKKNFVEKLLKQDSYSSDEQLAHRKILKNKVRRYIRTRKIVYGIIYVPLFLGAFIAFLKCNSTDSVIHSIGWGAVSLHILLWFLVFFLKMTYHGLVGIFEKNSRKYEKNRSCIIILVCVCLFSSFLLYFSFSLEDPLKTAQLRIYIDWSSLFFLFGYAFRIASLMSDIWLKYKQMELKASNKSNNFNA